MRLVTILLLLINATTTGGLSERLVSDALHQRNDSQPSMSQDYFPMAVWYGGWPFALRCSKGDPKIKRDIWRADLQKIKSLGFAERSFICSARRRKSLTSFLGWDLWSEPHVINWASATYLVSAEFCFCPYSVARYRDWLQKKYGSLTALNQAWYRRFTDWNQVEPNWLSTILSYTDYVDWRSFIADKLAEDLRLRYETVKSVLPDRVATSHAAGPSLFTSPLAGDGNPGDWLMAKQVDYWGTSFYPKHSFSVGRDPAWRVARLLTVSVLQRSKRVLDRRASERFWNSRAANQLYRDACSADEERSDCRQRFAWPQRRVGLAGHWGWRRCEWLKKESPVLTVLIGRWSLATTIRWDRSGWAILSGWMYG